jgi:MinD-like ATPase involved in chromosome partitioning or flagellar assembly
MKPFWITFYSYKGGVGRSLALSNIAALLVKNGRRVVLIDFDLEAPGLDSFDEFSCIVGKPGVVEYTSQFLLTGEAPKIEHFVHHCHLHDAPSGDLWIMPAGTKNAAYNHERANINWAEMYDGGVGVPFVENWKSAIARHCQPDYVLVDSRTGLTDVGGICTLHLPDLVVMLFGLNDQNIKGIAAVARSVRESNAGKIPQIHYVASPVPNMPAEKKDLVSERLETAKKEIGVAIESLIRYSSSASLHERLFSLDDKIPRSTLVTDYQNLLDKIIDYNRNGIDLITKEVESAISSSDTDKMQRLLSVINVNFTERAEGFYLLSRLNLALNDRPAAVQTAEKALSIDPSHGKAFRWLLKHYQAECQYAKALDLCDAALASRKRLSGEQIFDIQLEKGTVAMTASAPDLALTAYQLALETQQKFKLNTWLLALYFNLAESHRRASKKTDIDLWNKVIALFEQEGETSNLPPPIRTNCLQAMHIAFAVTGDIDRSKQTLLKASDSAKLLGSIDEVFSVKYFSFQPVSLFLQQNHEMLEALTRGELWDGMKL